MPRLAEIESLKARLSKVALPQSYGLATVDESQAVDGDEEDDEGGNDEEPGTPELSDEDEGSGRNAPRAKSSVAQEREAAKRDPVLAAALAEIVSHNALMFNITHNVGDAAKERAENRGLSAAEILAKSAAAGADLGDHKLSRLGVRMEQFEASREAAASRASSGADHAKSPMSDDVERTLNQPTSFPVSDGGGRSLTQTAARLAMASASVVANFLPEPSATPARAAMTLDLTAGPGDDNLPGLTSDSDSDDDKLGGPVP